MFVKTLLLDTIDSVREFVEIANTKEYQILLKSGGKTVDAKSIMSVFSLDLTKPVEMEADCKTVFEFARQVDKFFYKK